MKHVSLKHLCLGLASVLAVSTLTIAPVAAARGDGSGGSGGSGSGSGSSDSTTKPTVAPTTKTEVETEVHKSGSSLSSTEKAQLEAIKKRGSNEVSRRVNGINGLIKKVQAATYVSDADKAVLIAELNAALAGLQTTKTEVENDSDVSSVKTHAQEIISDYHEYAFIVPKVQLILTADRQQVIEAKLLDVATKLQTNIDAAKAAGADVTALQTKHDDMVTQTKSALTISSDVEAKLMALQSSGNVSTDHTTLKSYRDQLKTARKAIGAAVSDARSIVNGLKPKDDN